MPGVQIKAPHVIPVLAAVETAVHVQGIVANSCYMTSARGRPVTCTRKRPHGTCSMRGHVCVCTHVPMHVQWCFGRQGQAREEAGAPWSDACLHEVQLWTGRLARSRAGAPKGTARPALSATGTLVGNGVGVRG